MLEWILILTFIGHNSNSGQAMEHISGFKSEVSCQKAGQIWLANMKTKGYITANVTFVCIQRD